MLDLEKFIAEVKRYIGHAISPLASRLEKLESSAPDLGALVREAVAAIPAPQDGKSVTLEDVEPLISERVKAAVEAIPKPKDGEDGESVTAEAVLRLIEPEIAKWALDFERRAQDVLQRAIDRMPPPKDGKNGRDALRLEDFDLTLGDDERTVTMTLRREGVEISKSVRFPTVIYRGVHSDAGDYERSDSVTYAGSQWIALTDKPKGKPGTSKDWQLAVKCGRHGKDGRDGIDKAAPVKIESKK